MSKQQEIIAMFDAISPTYDRLNRILSFGIDRRWRSNGCQAALTHCAVRVETLLDVASGTGDLALFWRKAAARSERTIGKIVCIDPSVNMLEIAKSKVQNAEFLVSEAAAIPLTSGVADIVSISYGIRNVVELDAALSEFFRLLKTGGILLVLEFMGHKKRGILDRLMKFYLSKVLPAVGRVISKNSAAYSYLPASIDGFLNSEEFAARLANAGFEIVEIKDELFRISTRFIARKPL